MVIVGQSVAFDKIILFDATRYIVSVLKLNN